MITERIDQLELLEAGYENDPTMRVKVNFPFSAATGTKNTAVVYCEVEPGHRLGTHTDSAEELLLILRGEAEVAVGDEQGRVSAGEMALVSDMVPHSVRNVGDETVQVVGFFSSSTVMSTFDQPVMLMGQPPGEPPLGHSQMVFFRSQHLGGTHRQIVLGAPPQISLDQVDRKSGVMNVSRTRGTMPHLHCWSGLPYV